MRQRARADAVALQEFGAIARPLEDQAAEASLRRARSEVQDVVPLLVTLATRSTVSSARDDGMEEEALPGLSRRDAWIYAFLEEHDADATDVFGSDGGSHDWSDCEVLSSSSSSG